MNGDGGGPLFEEDGRRVLDYAQPRIPQVPVRPPMVSLWLGLVGLPVLFYGLDVFTQGDLWLGVLLCTGAVVAGHWERRVAKKRGVSRKTWPVVGLGMGWAGLALFICLFVVPLCMPRRPGRNEIRCTSNLRQIGQGIMLYANDNKGAFPQNFELLISDADLHPEVFVCPSSDDVGAARGATLQETLQEFRRPGHCSMVYLGAGLTDKTVVPNMILAHEKPGYHDGMGMNFLFGDFHVEWIGQREADRILAELKLGHNPPRPKNGGGR